MKKKKFKHWTGWMPLRLSKLPEKATTVEVRDVLKINERTLRMWTADRYFQQAEIAPKQSGRLEWQRDLLSVWLTALGALTERPPVYDEPNPWYTKEEARRELNIPLNHVIENSPKQEIDHGDVKALRA